MSENTIQNLLPLNEQELDAFVRAQSAFQSGDDVALIEMLAEPLEHESDTSFGYTTDEVAS